MKTVLIHGQNHKGSSYHIGRLIADQLAAPEETAEFFLPRDLNHFCLGCYRCLEDERLCPFYDEKKRILDALDSAELLVFTTPTYCLRASAPMKSFIDLTFTRWLPHRPEPAMFRKKAVVVSTAAGAGMRPAMKDVATCLKYWGVPYVKTLGFAVAAIDWDSVEPKTKQVIQRKADALARHVRGAQARVGLKTRFLFQLMKLNNGNPEIANGPMRADYFYWKNNGWLDGGKPY